MFRDTLKYFVAELTAVQITVTDFMWFTMADTVGATAGPAPDRSRRRRRTLGIGKGHRGDFVAVRTGGPVDERGPGWLSNEGGRTME